jgi:glucosamine--fructose-6-phosphate aminotransferase (isomerizing)
LTSRLRDEALQAPAVIAAQLASDGQRYADFGRALRAAPPLGILTLARGSSDHAAHYAAYLVMARLGRLVTSLPMSLLTLYGARLQAQGLLALAFSQSGQSPDLVEATRELALRGATTAAFVNDTGSPLARAAQWVFALHAGVERSVAASKSFVAQAVAGARLVAAWQDDSEFAAAIAGLPHALEAALAHERAWCDAALPLLLTTERLYVIGRGTGLAIALEAALKLKEVCGVHAEAMSGAELRHGPLALVAPGFAVLVFAPRGAAQAPLLAVAAQLRERGAQVLLAAPQGTPLAQLPLATTAEPDLDPIAAIAPFYAMVEALARARGRDPDAPPNLSKVTRTR